jgi:hypothetical protein
MAYRLISQAQSHPDLTFIDQERVKVESVFQRNPCLHLPSRELLLAFLMWKTNFALLHSCDIGAD